MASVRAQDYAGDIVHLVVIDDDADSVAVVESAPTRPGLRAEPMLVPRPEAEIGEVANDRRRAYPRVARLLNLALRACPTPWVSILDDDNEFEPDHLSSLMAVAQDTGAPAVHSGRQMFWADGTPYLEERWHTVSDPAEAVRIYELMRGRGVRLPDSNVLLDRADPSPVRSPFHPSSVIQDDDPVFLVDQNVWLIRRDVVVGLPIPETYTDDDYTTNTAPDDKLLRELLVHGVRVVSSGRPTVRYYLGGISQTH